MNALGGIAQSAPRRRRRVRVWPTLADLRAELVALHPECARHQVGRGPRLATMAQVVCDWATPGLLAAIDLKPRGLDLDAAQKRIALARNVAQRARLAAPVPTLALEMAFEDRRRSARDRLFALSMRWQTEDAAAAPARKGAAA
jgi:hypothetical protein